jgi:hypothetical protein
MIDFYFLHADWVGVACGLIGWWFMPTHRKRALLILTFGTLNWIFWAILFSHVWSVLFVQTCFCLLNIRVMYKEKILPNIFYRKH